MKLTSSTKSSFSGRWTPFFALRGPDPSKRGPAERDLNTPMDGCNYGFGAAGPLFGVSRVQIFQKGVQQDMKCKVFLFQADLKYKVFVFQALDPFLAFQGSKSSKKGSSRTWPQHSYGSRSFLFPLLASEDTRLSALRGFCTSRRMSGKANREAAILI